MHTVRGLFGLRSAANNIKNRAIRDMKEFDPRKASRESWRRAAVSLSVAAAAVTAGHMTGLMDGADSASAHRAPVSEADLKVAQAPDLGIEIARPEATALDRYAALTQDSVGAVAGLRVERVTIQSGDTIGRVLTRFNVSADQASDAISALKTVWNPRDLKVGQEITLYLETSPIRKVSTASKDVPDLVGLTIKPSVEKTVAVSQDYEGEFQVREIMMELNREIVRAEGEIDSALYIDANEAGATDRIIANFAQLYAYTVDIQRDIRQGDKFEILYERFTDDSGQVVKTGDIIYAGLETHGKLKELYRFDDGEAVDYYDAEGLSTKRFLMKTPINGARLSSHFGRRHHPVLGYTKMHEGTDFAAPRGTPIFASGDGVIETAYRSSSYGNYIRIKHSGGWKTAYAHMQKFASGMRDGARVSQGEVIGYVGTTGRSTGPHLHYEVLKNGTPVNPMATDVPTGKSLDGEALKTFMAARDQIDIQLANAPDAAAPDAELVASNDTRG